MGSRYIGLSHPFLDAETLAARPCKRKSARRSPTPRSPTFLGWTGPRPSRNTKVRLVFQRDGRLKLNIESQTSKCKSFKIHFGVDMQRLLMFVFLHQSRIFGTSF